MLTRDKAVTLMPIPGQTPDHVSLTLEDGDTRSMRAHDAAYLEETMQSATVDGVSPDAAIARPTLISSGAITVCRVTALRACMQVCRWRASRSI